MIMILKMYSPGTNHSGAFVPAPKNSGYVTEGFLLSPAYKHLKDTFAYAPN